MSKDTAMLTEKQIQQGKSLVAKLDQSGLKLEVAFWLYDPKRSPSWKLFLASSSPQLDVGDENLEARKLLSKIVQQVPDLADLPSVAIELIPLDHPFIKNIATTLSTGYEIANINMLNTRFDNLFIEGLHLYRMCV